MWLDKAGSLDLGDKSHLSGPKFRADGSTDASDLDNQRGGTPMVTRSRRCVAQALRLIGETARFIDSPLATWKISN